MEHDITALHGLGYTVRVANITGEDVQFCELVGGQSVQSAPAIEGVVVHEGTDIAAFVYERFREMASYEAVCTSHQDLLSANLHVYLVAQTGNPAVRLL